jgi:hypothetical protein
MLQISKLQLMMRAHLDEIDEPEHVSLWFSSPGAALRA